MNTGEEKLETDESFEKMERFIRFDMERVKNNPNIARDRLFRTGMHDEYGRLKPEFA